MTGVPSKHVVVLEDCGPVDIFVEVGLLTFVTFLTFVTWSCNYLTVVVREIWRSSESLTTSS